MKTSKFNPHDNCGEDSNHYCQDVWNESIADRDKEWVAGVEQRYIFPKWISCINPDCNPEISKRCEPLGQALTLIRTSFGGSKVGITGIK